MQPKQLSAADIYHALTPKLRWHWRGDALGGERTFDPAMVERARSSADLVGYLNIVHPHRVPVIGEKERLFFEGHPNLLTELLPQYLDTHPPLVVVADGVTPVPLLPSLCEQRAIALFETDESAAYVVDVMRSYLSKEFAERTSAHGVFMSIFGVGVLIQGEPGLGKSELGLELITRGHELVADDVVDLSLIAQGVIEGQCPELLKNMLEVRGIGLLNVRTTFGETAIRRGMRLRLVVHLVRREVWEQEYERLPTQELTQEILGVNVRKLVIPVEAGRNIAVLVEAAVRNTILQMQGIDVYQEFLRKQRALMDQQAPLA